MEKRFHGIDLHKRYATIMVRNFEGAEIQYIPRCTGIREYIDTRNLLYRTMLRIQYRSMC